MAEKRGNGELKLQKALNSLAEAAEPAGLAPQRRAAILRSAMVFTRERLASRPAGTWTPFIPRLAWGTALAIAVLVLGSGRIWMPAATEPVATASDLQDARLDSKSPAIAAGPRLISASYENGQMVLEWQNEGRGLHTLRQATSPKELRNRAAAEGATIKVRGSRFVASPPADEQVVFYVIE